MLEQIGPEAREDVLAVIEAFRAEGVGFLMPPTREALEDDKVIDISHESLIRQWRYFERWLREEEADVAELREWQHRAARNRDAGGGWLDEHDAARAARWRARIEERGYPEAWLRRYFPSNPGDVAAVFGYIDESARRVREDREKRERLERQAKESEIKRLEAEARLQQEMAVTSERKRARAEVDKRRAEASARASRRGMRVAMASTAVVGLIAAFVIWHWWWDVTSSHRVFGADCNTCHERAFVSVRASACTECHDDQPHHFDAERLKITALGDGQCFACHKEHGGALTRQDEDQCLDCHRNLKATAADSKLLDIEGGFADEHPEFRATFVTHVGGKDRAERIEMDRPGVLKERSNLFFPHKTHLDKTGILVPDGKVVVLDCASCHVPEPGGRLMAPIRFEQHCHRCHQLTFEIDDPSREVPHGHVGRALDYLQAYYSLRTLARSDIDTGAPDVLSRRVAGHRLAAFEFPSIRALGVVPTGMRGPGGRPGMGLGVTARPERRVTR